MDNVFHDHLDKCEQCNSNPFDLCYEGQRALRAAATGLPDPVEVAAQELRRKHEASIRASQTERIALVVDALKEKHRDDPVGAHLALSCLAAVIRLMKDEQY